MLARAHTATNSRIGTHLAAACAALAVDTRRMVQRCRARKKDGRLCMNRVKEPGQRCHKHLGMPEAGPRQTKLRRSRKGTSTPTSFRVGAPVPPDPRRPQSSRVRHSSTSTRQTAEVVGRRQRRAEAAAEFCAGVLTDGWQKAVAEKITVKYVTKATWEGLSRKHYIERCAALARFAAAILDGKKNLHGIIGRVVAWIVARLQGNRFEQALVGELAKKIPLPYEAKVVAVARGIQIVGILLCVIEGRDLARCECFVDLAVNEAKTRIKELLVAALDDWAKLGEFGSRS